MFQQKLLPSSVTQYKAMELEFIIGYCSFDDCLQVWRKSPLTFSASFSLWTMYLICLTWWRVRSCTLLEKVLSMVAVIPFVFLVLALFSLLSIARCLVFKFPLVVNLYNCPGPLFHFRQLSQNTFHGTGGRSLKTATQHFLQSLPEVCLHLAVFRPFLWLFCNEIRSSAFNLLLLARNVQGLRKPVNVNPGLNITNIWRSLRLLQLITEGQTK